VERKEVIYLLKLFLPAVTSLEEGRRGLAPCGLSQYQAIADPFSVNFARVLIGQWINQ
jgi:hypothetical protein